MIRRLRRLFARVEGMADPDDRSWDVRQGGDETIAGQEVRDLPVGSVVRWERARNDGGLRCHTPTEGWVPSLGDDALYHVIFVPPRGQR